MQEEVKKFQFWKVFLPIYLITFFLVLFVGYGFPSDFKTWKFGFEEFIYIAIFYTLPLATIFTFLVKWVIRKKRREETVTSYEVIKKTSGFAVLSFFLTLFAAFTLLMCWDCQEWLSIITPVLAIFFGIISLRDIKRENLRGRPFAILGIILGIWELSFVILLLLSYYRLI